MAERRKAPKGCYWRGATLWGGVTVQGRKVRFSLRTDDATIAEGRLKARREREIAAAHFGDARPTWEDAVVAWGDHIAGHTKPNTQKRYAVSLKQLAPYLVGCYLDEIDKKLVGEIIRRRRAQNVTNATIRRDLVALSSVLGYCEEEGWKDNNPALTRMKTLKERRDAIVLPEPEDIQRVIDRAPGLFAKLIEAAWLTGCRQNELVTLTRHQLDMNRGTITLEGNRTKNRRSRVINMGPAYHLFRSLPVNLGAKQVVFWHSLGEPYRNAASRFALYVKWTQKRTQRFRPFRFHDLRHRFAVDYLKKGGNLYDLMKHLGHSSVKVTEAYLDYLTPEEAHNAKHGAGTEKDTDVTVWKPQSVMQQGPGESA
jgi:integrase/recombinase XerD